MKEKVERFAKMYATINRLSNKAESLREDFDTLRREFETKVGGILLNIQPGLRRN